MIANQNIPSEEASLPEDAIYSNNTKTEKGVERQAEQLEKLLPRMMRYIFISEPGQPAGDLTLAQLRVCTLLQEGTHSLSSVARELGISTSAATQIADRLERLGLVERISQIEDRRAKHLLLTLHGEGVMRARRQRRIERVRNILEQVPLAQRVPMLTAVEALLDAARNVPVAAVNEYDVDC